MENEVLFEVFRGTLTSWNALFSDAADFAAAVGSQRLINISHCCDHNEGVVTVWYWSV